jgi:dihydroorotate dehydrogenase (fumarate)
MASLKTTYLGIELDNPVIAGACSLTSHMDSIKKIEDSGAAALVIASLFEEQIQLERLKLEEDVEKIRYRHPEMINIFPDLEHAGPQEHLAWVRRAKEGVRIPVIASLNAVSSETWVEYAGLLEQTGVDGLELNFFAVPSEFDLDAGRIEEEQVNVLKAVKAAVGIPVSVKLSINYTNPLHFIRRVDEAGVGGMVLFNRFFQPEINVETEEHQFPFNFSAQKDSRLPLRYAGLLYDQVRADVCSSTGIMEGRDVVKMILAGARCVQCVSAMYLHKVPVLKKMISEVEQWMDRKGYASLDDFRGKLSRKNSPDPWRYTRAQYVRVLMKPSAYLKNAPVL